MCVATSIRGPFDVIGAGITVIAIVKCARPVILVVWFIGIGAIFLNNPLLASNALVLSGDKLGGDGLDVSDKGSHDDSLYGCLSGPDGT